jgi:hypothetical protein
MKKNIFTTVFLIASIAFSSSIFAKNITLTIEGEGEILAKEANQSCSENCTINNDLAINTLQITPNAGWTFSGWTGQQCDSGSEVVIEGTPKRLSSASNGAKTLVTADLNNDNLDDFVSISLFDGVISVELNEGNSGFNATVVDQLSYPTALDLYDWNGDGHSDLFVAEYRRGEIQLYLNDGLGVFTHAQTLKFDGFKPYSFVVTDKNDDGLADILVSSFRANTHGDLLVLVNSIEDAVTQWFINVEGEFVKEEKISDNAAMTLDTYKTDNQLYISAAEIVTGEVAIYQAGIRKIVDTGGGTYGVSFGDIDNDGLVDLLAAHYRPSSLKLMYGMSNGNFSSPLVLDTPSVGITATTFGDYNDDGYVDVATSEFNNNAFHYYPTKSYKDCIVSSNSDISLTATFSLLPGNADMPIPKPNETNETTGSSGGSFPYVLFLFSGLVCFYRKQI